jgi:hypothetical protein
LVEPSNDSGVICFNNLSRDDQSLPVDAVRFVCAGAGFGRTGVVDRGEGGLVPVFECGRVDRCLVDLVEEELVRVWIEGFGIRPALANWWMLVGKLCVNVDRWMLLGVVDGE